MTAFVKRMSNFMSGNQNESFDSYIFGIPIQLLSVDMDVLH